MLGIFNNTYRNYFTIVANGIFSELPDSVESPPGRTGTDGMNRDKNQTQVSSEPQKSDTIPCEQGLVQCTEGIKLSGIN